MKTNPINKTLDSNDKKVSFKGHNAYLTDMGFKRHNFFMPYDENKYTATVEFQGFKDDKGEWIPITHLKSIPLPPQGVSIADAAIFSKSNATGYRFVFTDKSNPERKIYKVDSGITPNPLSGKAENNFSILLNNRSLTPENKLTKQVMPDLLPGYSLKQFSDGGYELRYSNRARKDALKTIRNHGNKLGGNFAGIIKLLPTWRDEGYTKIVGTPFTKDEVSSHLYWTENPFQVSNALGSLDDFRSLQIELFKNGINFIADGAFVNQGIQGTMFRHILKHGEKSPYLHWFKAPGLLDGDLKLGTIPQNKKARENFRFRLVNMPFKLHEEENEIQLQKNHEYNAKNPSYIQIYDKRLVSKNDLRKSNELLTKYSIPNTKNPYEITSHDDLTQLLTFEVNPKNYSKFLEKQFSQYKDLKINNSNHDFIENLLQFPYFRLTTKDKGGIDLWDGNMDIAKLNFYIGNTDQQYINKFESIADRKNVKRQMNESIYQVQDFTLKAGKYWTKLVSDIQFEYILNLIRNAEPTVDGIYKTIQNNIKNGKLPPKTKEVITKDVIKNILEGNYNPIRKTPNLLSNNQMVEFVRKQVMDLPFAAYEFSPDLSAVITSPILARYATSKEELGTLRYDEYISHLAEEEKIDKHQYTEPYLKMSEYLYEDLGRYVSLVFHRMNRMRLKTEPQNMTHEPSLFDVTDVGYYLIPLLLPDIAKYAILKSLNPQAEINIDEESGQIRINPKEFTKLSLKSLNISGSPEDEAMELVKKLKHGTKKLIKTEDYAKLAKILLKRVENISYEKFLLADAILDRTGSGLGWRIDAAKDIANIDAIRSGNDNDERLFTELSDFWGKFNDTVKSANPNAYTTAEITDFGSVLKTRNGEYKNFVNAETKFIERSGLNNTANYMFFFSLLRDFFALHAEYGYQPQEFDKIKYLKEKLIEGWNSECHGFLYQYPGDSISNSYTFVGNHDKPRVLHLFALDMGLFHSDFSNNNHVERAAKVLGYGSDCSKIDIYTLSGQAIAMGEKILEALDSCGLNNPFLKEAVAQLANGNYKGEKFKADVFGTRDFRFAIKDVFDVAESLGYETEEKEQKMDKVLAAILTPAMDKMQSVYKMLVTLPGAPTDFIGDKEGSSGYETKSNNEYQQNRNVVPLEWVNDVLKIQDIAGEEKEFAKDHYIKMTQIGSLRNKIELSALNDGDTISLPLQEAAAYNGNTKLYDTTVAATFRYNDKGSQVICLYTTAGANGTADGKKAMERPTVNLEKIVLSDASNWKCGIKGGLNVGDKFKNMGEDGVTYEVQLENNQYVLKRINDGLKHISILPSDKNTAVLYKYDETKQKPIPAHFVFSKLNNN